MSFAACVIGGGPAGIQASLALRNCGGLVTCFEIQPTLGGIWNAHGHDIVGPRGISSPIYPSMRCVLPKDLMAFGDKKMDFTVPQFPHHSAVSNYLQSYGKWSGVHAVCRYNTKVDKVERDTEKNCWKVTTVNFNTGDVYEWRFDAVVVATGRTHTPRFPDEDVPDNEPFISRGGAVLHVSEAKKLKDFDRKRVIVVGDGVAAYDHCQQLKAAGAVVFHSTMLAPTTRDPSSEKEAEADASQPRSKGLSGVLNKLPLDNTEHKGREILCKWLRKTTAKTHQIPRVGKIVDFGEGGGRSVIVEVDPTANVSKADLMVQKARRSALEKEEDDWKKKHQAVAEDSSLEAAPPEDDTKIEIEGVDTIIYATGYHLKFPFLPDEIRSQVESSKESVLRLRTTTMPSTPEDLKDAATSARGNEAQKPPEEETRDEGDRLALARLQEDRRNGTELSVKGLFMGCVYLKEPSLGFVGLPNDLLPPFLMFQAQGRFTAQVVSGQLPLPATEAAMREYEAGFSSIYSARGAGLDSIQYFNALQNSSEGEGTFSDKIFERRWWYVGSFVMWLMHKWRVYLIPLKRKAQHVLISNKV